MSHPDVALNNRVSLWRTFPLVEKWFLRRIFKAIGPAPVKLRFTDGQEISAPSVSPIATVTIHDYRTLAQLMVDPEVAFGEAYAAGRVQVQGDLVRLLESVYESMASARPSASWYQSFTSYCMDWL